MAAQHHRAGRLRQRESDRRRTQVEHGQHARVACQVALQRQHRLGRIEEHDVAARQLRLLAAPGDQVARKILEIEGCERYRTEGFVLEGGSIHVDGEGTLITTEECLLNRNRNPELSRQQIESLLHQHLGTDTVIWLPDGLFNDETDGHVDNFCCYVRPGEVLLAWTDDPQSPNYSRCQAAMAVLSNTRDAKGRQLIVHKMPIPGPLHATVEECAGVDAAEGTQERDPSIRLAGSYVNFLIVNGGIIAPKFYDPMDAEAEAILQRLFPEHRVVMVPGREILLGGGNIHCITQQQPAPQRR